MLIPYDYQNAAVESIFQYYAVGGTGNPVVAMPTASGKSLVIAEFCKYVLQRWPRQRILLSTHVKELIEQNADELRQQWPGAPLGVFSAGLGLRETAFPIVYGGVQSMVNCISAFGWRDLLIVDEAHLISQKDGSNYQLLIAGLRLINPNIKVIGLTATPYRLGQGLITDGGMFTDICFDLTSFKEFNKLIAGGYLCSLIPKRTHTELISDKELEKLTTKGGDYNQTEAQAAVDKDDVTYKACLEVLQEGFDRQAWLLFAQGIEHAEHITSILQSMGVDAASVHSKMPAEEATKRIKAFKAGKLRAIVNYGKLTTGFNYPAIDLIAVMRLTTSTALWVQLLGRGTRPSIATGKANCLVLDFARNTERLGPINDPVIPRKRVKGTIPGVAPIRICPACGVYNHARATVCCVCGSEFPKVSKLTPYAGTHELIRSEEAIIGDFQVQRVVYARHQKIGKPPLIKVQYFCGLQLFHEYFALEHGGMASKIARGWWQEVSGQFQTPPSTDEALKYVSGLKVPKMIKVRTDLKYPEVIQRVY